MENEAHHWKAKNSSCANPASPHVTPQRWFKSLTFENFVQKTTTPDQMVDFASKVLIRGRFTDLATCSSNWDSPFAVLKR